MAATQQKTNWTVIIAGVAVFFSIASAVLNTLNSGSEKLEKRVSQIEGDLTWKYVTREFAAKDIGFIDRTLADLKAGKVDKDVYDLTVANLERRHALLREAVRELERSGRGK